MTAPLEQRGDVSDGALLAALGAVAVVEQEDAHGGAGDCVNVPPPPCRSRCVTNYLTPYRLPLYERLAERHGLEVLCFGGGERYVPAWFSDLDRQLESAPFPAHRLDGPRAASAAWRATIERGDRAIRRRRGAARGLRRRPAPSPRTSFCGRRCGRSRARSRTRSRSPVTRHIYRHADAVVAYGEHVRRFAAGLRGHDDDMFVAPQAVEPELFARTVCARTRSELSVRARLAAGTAGPLRRPAGARRRALRCCSKRGRGRERTRRW